MSDKELIKIWKKVNDFELVTIHQDNLLHDLGNELSLFEKTIRKRDKTEIGIALGLIPLFAVIAYFVPSLISKIGALLVIPSALLVVFMLKKVKKHKKEDLSAPLKNHLIQYKIYVEKEIQLLKNVVYWYLLPLFLCLTLFYFGFEYPLFFIFLNMIIYVYIYYLNKKAIRNYFLPLIEKIDSSIKMLEDTERDSNG